MKISTKFFRLFTLAFIVSFSAKAQDANMSIGARLSNYTYGASISYITNPNQTLEGILNVDHSNRRYLLTALYTEDVDINNADGLQFHYGAGIHAGFLKIPGSNTIQGKNINIIKPSASFIVGADAILSLDYQLSDFPIIIGTDIKPYVDFMNGESALTDVALTVKYVF